MSKRGHQQDTAPIDLGLKKLSSSTPRKINIASSFHVVIDCLY